MLKIIIDNREAKLLQIIMERDLDSYKDIISIHKEQLDISDIIINYNDQLLFYYERKTVSDLVASIKDGRYKEQKARLLSSNANSINYIIEGDSITSIKNKNNQKMITSAYINSIYRDNINILFSNDLNDTATLLLLIATKIIDNPSNFINKPTINTDYIDVCKIKTEKNKNIDKKTCYLLQLSQIPTISKELAKNIYNEYPSLSSLLVALNTTEDKIGLLTKIDKIGKTKATTIINYLL